jgi:TolA-binding protein
MTFPLSLVGRLSRRFPWGSLIASGLLLAAGGCITPWERSALLKDDLAEIGSVQGPTERRLRGYLKGRPAEATADEGLLKPIAGTDDYLAAEELYEAGQYAEAEKAFKKVARKYKKSEIREDALFMQAESAFAQQKYAAAHDRYAQLLKDSPTTRHLDVISQRLFKIAMIWLDHPRIAEMDEIQQVNHERYGERLPPKEGTEAPKRNIFIPNFTDQTKPIFDAHGNALAALKSIWTNDPTGPLADDALMLAASYYARTGDFLEADRHFTLLREQFPNSPHVQKAFELGSHVKLMSYQGAMYDGKALHDSEQLKLATLRLYPEFENKERLEAELKKIEDAKADRLWALVKYYEGKGRKKSAAVYCHMLLSEHPKSKHAQAARDRLEQYGPAYADGRALMNPYPDPPKTLLSAILPPDDRGGEPAVPPPPQAKPEQPKYGAKLALIKPERVQNPAPQPKTAESDAGSPPRRGGWPRIVPPRQLPEDIDARPAPPGKSRLESVPPADEEADDDTSAGHTRL